jgi:hypothetical protein
MGGLVSDFVDMGKSAVKSISNVGSKAIHGLEKVGQAQINQLKGVGKYTDKMNHQLAKGQLGAAGKTTIEGVVNTGDQSIVDSTSRSDANVIIPVATAIVGTYNPVFGAALTAARAYAQGASPLQVAKQAGIAYAGSAAGGAAGGAAAPVGGGLGTAAGTAGVSAGVNSTTQGLIRGHGLNQSLREGAASGLAAGATTGLFGAPTKADSIASAAGRALTNYELGNAARGALGVSPAVPGAPTATASGLPVGLGATGANSVASATPSGPANVTGGAVDITGSDPNEARSNVWNKGSLKIKDALGA